MKFLRNLLATTMLVSAALSAKASGTAPEPKNTFFNEIEMAVSSPGDSVATSTIVASKQEPKKHHGFLGIGRLFGNKHHDAAATQEKSEVSDPAMGGYVVTKFEKDLAAIKGGLDGDTTLTGFTTIHRNDGANKGETRVYTYSVNGKEVKKKLVEAAASDGGDGLSTVTMVRGADDTWKGKVVGKAATVAHHTEMKDDLAITAASTNDMDATFRNLQNSGGVVGFRQAMVETGMQVSTGTPNATSTKLTASHVTTSANGWTTTAMTAPKFN